MKENCFYFCRNPDGDRPDHCWFDVRVINPGMKSLLYSRLFQCNVRCGLFDTEEVNFIKVDSGCNSLAKENDYFTFRNWLNILSVDFQDTLVYLTNLGFEVDVTINDDDWPNMPER